MDPGDLRWSLHGAQDFVFHDAILPGMVLHTRAAPVGVHPWLTGTAVVLKTETRAGGSLLDPDGKAVLQDGLAEVAG